MAIDKDSLIGFLASQLGVETEGIDADTPLFTSGIIDSASMVDLIVYVESETSVRFGPDDISLDYLDSIGRILSFVADRSGE